MPTRRATSVVDGTVVVAQSDGSTGVLEDPDAFAGYPGGPDVPSSILLEQHGLGIEIIINRDHDIGSTDPAGIADVVLESAPTSIMDFEDSIAAVDSADKALAYHYWLGLITGTLTEQVTKNGHPFTVASPTIGCSPRPMARRSFAEDGR